MGGGGGRDELKDSSFQIRTFGTFYCAGVGSIHELFSVISFKFFPSVLLNCHSRTVE
jgi:hypothetical protein